MLRAITEWRHAVEEGLFKRPDLLSSLRSGILFGAVVAMMSGLIGFALLASSIGVPTTVKDVFIYILGTAIVLTAGFVAGWCVSSFVFCVFFVIFSICIPRSIRVFGVAAASGVMTALIKYPKVNGSELALYILLPYSSVLILATVVEICILRYWSNRSGNLKRSEQL
ncbi:MAG: hypothetical protein C0478_04615 [Planctomyces sp.]|nr:hypothetical protein [Planctomyces sp.]